MEKLATRQPHKLKIAGSSPAPATKSVKQNIDFSLLCLYNSDNAGVTQW
jgi:hypothetical protein